MESQKHAIRFDHRYDTYSGLWCHKPLEKLGFGYDFVKLIHQPDHELPPSRKSDWRTPASPHSLVQLWSAVRSVPQGRADCATDADIRLTIRDSDREAPWPSCSAVPR